MFIQLSLTIILITGSVLIVHFNKEKDNRLLTKKNKQLSDKIEKLQSDYEYVSSRSTDSKSNDFENWSNIEEKANILYEDSNGEFKKSWAIFLVKQSEKYELDPVLVYELLKVETGDTFDPNLVGPKTEYGRAYGMGQFMKNTAPWVAEMAQIPYKEKLLFDPYYSMQLSVVYLDYLYKKYNDWNKALTAYHRGIKGLENYIDENGDAKSWYAKEIQSKKNAYEALATAN